MAGFLLYRSFCLVIFFEAVCSQETADQETSNYAKIFVNSHPPGGGERERETETERENIAYFKRNLNVGQVRG